MEVVCINRYGFFSLSHKTNYGPSYMEICEVEDFIDLGGKYKFFHLKGYSIPDPHFVTDKRVFNIMYFVQVPDSQQLQELLKINQNL